ncbi:hypothetical protein WJX81_001234 [Elliptochloris bilobata]|uniref:Uncharacterized protein n=1 Tax=Elliptochloris bilobata TaxID=381761 RepID=A0AAW1RC31_9CHLO
MYLRSCEQRPGATNVAFGLPIRAGLSRGGTITNYTKPRALQEAGTASLQDASAAPKCVKPGHSRHVAFLI